MGPFTTDLKKNAPLQCGSLRKEGKNERFYLTTHSTHFIYGYMASDIR